MMPKPRELVVAEVVEIHSNSIELKLLDYGNSKAFLNVANIPGLWIRDLKKFMKKGEVLVAKTLNLSGGQIELSMKDVSKYDSEKKLEHFRKEAKSIRIFKNVSKEFGLEDGEVEVAVSKLKDKFGGVYESMKALRDADEDLDLGQKFKSVIERFSAGEKSYEFKGELELHSNSGNGVECIKKALDELGATDATYIGNTKFLIRLSTGDPKRGEKMLEAKAQAAIKKMQSLGGTGKFSLSE